LLTLTDDCDPETEFGFVFRHYWDPPSQLLFQQSSLVMTLTRCEGTQFLRATIQRRPVRSEANLCVWREQVTPFPADASSSDVFSPGAESLCCYDCYEQAYWSRDVASSTALHADEVHESQRQALYALPFLVPPGPVPLGFQWHGRVGSNVMNYEFVSAKKIRGMTVAFIRRHGWYTLTLPQIEGNALQQVTTERKGLSAFALHRGVVLEDRILDCIVAGSPDCRSYLNTRTLVVTRLVQASPYLDAQV
jgi:hypothetical protein